MLHIILRLHPKWYWVSAIPIAIQLASSWLFGTVTGVFVFSLSLYAFQYWLGDTKPYTIEQTALWFDSLSVEAKGSLASSVVTAVGFLIAFRAAAMGWTQQARYDARAKAADEFEDVYSEASMTLLRLISFARSILKEASIFQETQDADSFNAHQLLDLIARYPAYIADGEKLFQLQQRANALTSKNYVTLMSLPGALQLTGDLNSLIQKAALASIQSLPQFDAPLPTLFSCIDLAKWSAAKDTMDAAYDRAGGMKGLLRGALLTHLSKVTLITMLDMYRQRNLLRRAMLVVQDNARTKEAE